MKKIPFKIKLDNGKTIESYDIEYTRADLIKKGEKIAKRLGKTCFAEVLEELENGNVKNTSLQFEIKSIKHLLGM